MNTGAARILIGITRLGSALLAIGMVRVVNGAEDPTSALGTGSGGAPVTQQVQAEFEGLFSSDVRLTQSSASYDWKKSRYEWRASVSYQTFDVAYRPASFDFLGRDASIDQRRMGVQLGGKLDWTESLKLLGGGGLYDGYGDFRSAWLNEYYRQQFSDVHGFGDEYVDPAPRGENLSVGLRWEYLPSAGFVEGGLGYSHDRIAPGYEIDFGGLRHSRPDLYTGSYRLSFENVLTRRVRVLNEFRATDTTNRQLRYSYQMSLNYAVAEDLVLRAVGGYTREKPDFEAYFGGGSAEWEAIPRWLLSVSGRWYRDTGEIENSLFSSAAPGLTAWQFGIGLRHTWGPYSAKLLAGPYFTSYEPAGIGTAFFQNLYKNRTWALVQAAFAAEF